MSRPNDYTKGRGGHMPTERFSHVKDLDLAVAQAFLVINLPDASPEALKQACKDLYKASCTLKYWWTRANWDNAEMKRLTFNMRDKMKAQGEVGGPLIKLSYKEGVGS